MSRSILIWSVLATLLFSVSVSAQRNRLSASEKRLAQTEPVRFANTEAVADANGALVTWKTSLEQNVLGFRVLRWNGSTWERLGYEIVPGSFLSPDPEVTKTRDYRFFDTKGEINSAYAVQAQTTSGKTISSRVFYPAYVSNFVDSNGTDSRSMREGALSSKPLITSTNVLAPKAAYESGNPGFLPPNPSNQFWVASRPGVKIGITKEGIYRVSRTELENAGFDVNTDPSLWQLYLNGNEQSIIVEPTGAYIEFYGVGVDTRSTNKNIYFLLVGDVPGARMAEATRPSTGPEVASGYTESYYRKDRTIYVSSVTNGDKENFFAKAISPTPVDVTLDLTDLDTSSLKTTIRIGLQGYTAVAHQVAVSVNGVQFGKVYLNGEDFKVADIGVPTQILMNGTNTVSLVALGGSSDISLVEYVSASYKRMYVARNDELAFSMDADKAAEISGFTDSSIRVFDITSSDSPAVVTDAVVNGAAKLGSTFTVTVPSNSAALMYAAADSAVLSADSIVFNTPSTFSDSSNDSQMVIITNGGWKTQAESWAAYRASDGVTTETADVEDIYDEFNYGRKGPEALREFIHYAILNWSGAPGYIFLIGDATYDPRNYTGAGFLDNLPTQMIETAYEETGSDEAIADYDDDGLSEVSIGRAPVRNATQVTDALTKVQTFESALASAPARGAMCASDVFQIIDFEALCDRVIAPLPESIPKISVNKGDVDARVTLLAEMNLGKYVINYSGHGSTISWTSGGFFGTGDVSTLTNTNDLTIYTMLTCLNGYFIATTSDSLSEKLFKATNGGAVATWSSSGKTTPDVQEVLGTRFYDKLGNEPSLFRLGDLVKDAKLAVIASRDVRLSWTLLGDPAMRAK